MSQLTKAKAQLQKIAVCYQDDRLISGQERWKVFTLNEATMTLNYLGEEFKLWPDNVKTWKEIGFFNCMYGTFFRNPSDSKILRGWVTCSFVPSKVLEELGLLRSSTSVPNAQAIAVLRLTYPCTVDEIKAAYREAVKRVHPDAGGSAEEFHLVQAAYEELMEACQSCQ